MSDLEEELETAVKEQEKSRARAILNQLLRYVYTPRPDQVALIKSRAAQLVLLLPQFALMSGSDTKEAAIYEYKAVSLGVKGYRLPQFCGVILYRYVL